MCVLKMDKFKEIEELLEQYEEGVPPRSSKYQDGGE